MIKYRRTLNLAVGVAADAIRLRQYDTDVTIEFDIVSSEGIFSIEEGTTISVRGMKPDGNGITGDGELVIKEHPKTHEKSYIATVEVTEQMTACAGLSDYELVMTKDGKALSAGHFAISVQRAALDKDTLPSGSEIRELVEVVDRKDEIVKAAKGISKTVKTAETLLATAEEIAGYADEVKAMKDGILAEIEAWKAEMGNVEDDAVQKVEAVAEGYQDTIETTKTEIKSTKDGILADLQTIRDIVIKAITTEKDKAVTEITERIDTDSAISSTASALAEKAVIQASNAEKVVNDFVNNMGNVKGRLDALESEVYKN